MSEQILNAACTELKVTPNKRKRDDIRERKSKQFNNYGSNKENHFIYNNFMEEKSIAELVEIKKQQSSNAENPFELVRKPPKKKNRKNYSDDGCFVNPALNLNGPEKILNPFEVLRSAPLPEVVHHCFENTGLNIKVEDRQVNPFEVARENVSENPKGIENPGLDVRHAPLAIGVPFTPTVGCRIDFKNINIEDLTPSALLNRHLILSPVKALEETAPKRPNLSVISEEAVDISKELECYQLEIENSMNEAKATNKQSVDCAMASKKDFPSLKQLTSVNNENEKKPKITKTEPNIAIEVAQLKTDEHLCHAHETSNGPKDCPKSSTPKTPNENCIAKYSLDRSFTINENPENPDIVYEEVNDSHISNDIPPNKNVNAVNNEIFKDPAPFVRVYRRDVPKKPSNAPIKTTNEKQFEHDEKLKDSHEGFIGIRSSIRKSIRKLINPNGSKNSNEVKPTKDQLISAGSSNNILTTIRHSLRRKQPKQPLATSTPRQSLNEISIIDTSEPRTVYKDTVFSARVNHVDDNLLRSKNNLRNSFRRSKHAMKSVFKRNTEDYGFEK